MSEFVLVGGSHDGERVEVHGDFQVIEQPVMTNVKPVWPLTGDVGTATMSIERYRRTFLGFRGMYWEYFVLEGMLEEQALDLIIRSYRGAAAGKGGRDDRAAGQVVERR